jgi:hypothetical protein
MLESNSLTTQMSQAETATERRKSLRAPSISWDDSRAVMSILLAAFSTQENT